MNSRTLDLLDAAFDAFCKDLAPQVAILARKSTSGTLSHDEHDEYAQIVRMNDLLTLIKLEADKVRAAQALIR